jgi:hypothetical protein
VYTLGSGEGVRTGGRVQVSDYIVCMSRRWCGGGAALCCRGLVAAVGVENVF